MTWSTRFTPCGSFALVDVASTPPGALTSKPQKHINLLEMKALMREERRLARRCFNMRIPVGLDSQVVLGASVKGRASSTALTRELKKNLGYGIGNDLYNFFMFFPSAMNRADGPSRRQKPKDPDVALPAWWPEALQGDFTTMDKWLSSASDFIAEKRIPFELLLGANVDMMRPARTAKKCKQPKHLQVPLSPSGKGDLGTFAEASQTEDVFACGGKG